jgi:anti-sigma factor RsiW
MSDEVDLTCERCGRAFDDLLTGSGRTPLHRRIEERLENEPGCQRCFATYKKTTELCRARLATELPKEVIEKLLAALRAKTEKA